MRLVLSSLVVLATVASAAAATDADLKTSIAGKWADTASCATGGYMQFNADGTFFQSAPPGAPTSTAINGTYDIKNGQLTGLANGQTMGPEAISFADGKMTMSDSSGSDAMVKCQ